MKHRIDVTGIKIYAYHGCLSEEERIGGSYIVDLSLQAELGTSFASDKLSDTIDYVALNKVVQEEMGIRSRLIEHVAQRIYRRIKQMDARVQQLSVKVRKLTPPINGEVDEVAFTIED